MIRQRQRRKPRTKSGALTLAKVIASALDLEAEDIYEISFTWSTRDPNGLPKLTLGMYVTNETGRKFAKALEDYILVRKADHDEQS